MRQARKPTTQHGVLHDKREKTQNNMFSYKTSEQRHKKTKGMYIHTTIGDDTIG